MTILDSVSMKSRRWASLQPLVQSKEAVLALTGDWCWLLGLVMSSSLLPLS